MDAQSEQDLIVKQQAYYDEIMREVGLRAPAPILGQSVRDYRRETLRMLKYALPENHELRQVNYRGLRTDSLNALEPQVMAAFKAEKINPNRLADGELKEVTVLNEYGQVREKRFIGKECFVKFMGRPGRRVVNIMRSTMEPILSRREIA